MEALASYWVNSCQTRRQGDKEKMVGCTWPIHVWDEKCGPMLSGSGQVVSDTAGEELFLPTTGMAIIIVPSSSNAGTSCESSLLEMSFVFPVRVSPTISSLLSERRSIELWLSRSTMSISEPP